MLHKNNKKYHKKAKFLLLIDLNTTLWDNDLHI